jgi:hypothetical protein
MCRFFKGKTSGKNKARIFQLHMYVCNTYKTAMAVEYIATEIIKGLSQSSEQCLLPFVSVTHVIRVNYSRN